MKNIISFFLLIFLSITSFAQTKEVKPAIFVAVEKGNIDELRALIKSGANVNQMYEGISLLNAACGKTHGSNKLVKVLLDAPGIDVKKITPLETGFDKSYVTTPLIALISSVKSDSKVDNVIKLIKKGVDINYHSSFNNGGTALFISTFGKQSEESKVITMAILNNAGKELYMNFIGIYNLTAYRNAVNEQHLEAVELILKRGAWVEDVNHDGKKIGMIFETIKHENHDILDVIMKYGANKYGPNSECLAPLNMSMIDAKDAEWAEYFIKKYKVDVNYIGKAGSIGDEIAINTAASFNNVAGLDVLFKHGAKVNLSTSQGINAIQTAALHNSLDAAKYLIEKGTKVNGYNSLFFNAISYATIKYNTEMLELLVKNGADVNAVTKESPWAGPLARIAMQFDPLEKKQRMKTLNKLLELGADPNVLHAQDMTALMCAAKLASPPGQKAALDICEVLIAKGANVNLVTTAGETALMMASATGNLKLVTLLIKSGADVNKATKVNETALSYAKRAPSNKTSIISALEKAGAKEIANTITPVLTSVPNNLVGTWKGYQTDEKIFMATFVINKDNTYSYYAEYKLDGKIITSFNHKGKILTSEDSYTLIPEGQASATYSYKIVNGKLSANNGRPLDKIK